MTKDVNKYKEPQMNVQVPKKEYALKRRGYIFTGNGSALISQFDKIESTAPIGNGDYKIGVRGGEDFIIRKGTLLTLTNKNEIHVYYPEDPYLSPEEWEEVNDGNLIDPTALKAENDKLNKQVLESIKKMNDKDNEVEELESKYFDIKTEKEHLSKMYDELTEELLQLKEDKVDTENYNFKLQKKVNRLKTKLNKSNKALVKIILR